MSKRQTWDSLIRGGESYVEKSQADESGRYFTPRNALVAGPSPSGFVKTVVDSIKRKVQAQEAARDEDGRVVLRSEKVLDRRPNFIDFVVANTRNQTLRMSDDYDAAIETDDTDSLIADLLAGLDEEAEKSKWIGFPTYIQKSAEPGDYITKSGVNISEAIRRGVAEALR